MNESSSMWLNFKQHLERNDTKYGIPYEPGANTQKTMPKIKVDKNDNVSCCDIFRMEP